MYYVRIFNDENDTTGTLIHSPHGIKCRFSVNLVLKGVSSMSITLTQNNPAFNQIKPFKTLIEVTHAQTNKVVFKGRFLNPEHKMNDSGLLTLKYDCESRLAYLHDSRQRWQRVHDTTISDFLESMLNIHNQQVESHKRFNLGVVTVQNNTDNVYRYVGYGSTLDEIQDNLIDRLGGYLQVRDEPDGMYLDYLADVGVVSDTTISLRSNLKNFQRRIDPTNIITRLVPLGARIETEEEHHASEPRLTIESVNDGLDYMDNQSLIDEFGIIEGTVVFDGVNVPSILKTRGEQFFQAQETALLSYDITAINLALKDVGFADFEVGNWHDISTYPLMDIQDTLQIIQIKLDSDNPQRDQLTFGDKPITLSQYQTNINKQARIVENLQDQVDSQSRLISEITNEVHNVENNLETVQQAIIDADIEGLPDAIDALEQAITNLNDALDGIPIYDVATHTQDGLMASVDKVKLDSLQVYQEATELLSGLMSASDKEKLNRITVTEPIDLDDVLSRLEALEAPEDPEE